MSGKYVWPEALNLPPVPDETVFDNQRVYMIPDPDDPHVGRLVAIVHEDGHRVIGRLARITHDQDGARLTITEEP